MLTLRNIFEEGLQLLDIENASLSAPDIRQSVIRAINAALQTLQTSGRDYFTRQIVSLTLAAGQAAYALPGDVLNVFPPARLTSGAQLREVSTRGELDLFAQLYLGSVHLAPASGQPMACFLERLHASGSNPGSITLYLAPTPDQAYSAEVSVSKAPPVYSLSDVSDPSPVVPVPQQFGESILLPLVRWQLRLSRLFRFPDKLPALQQDYEAALVQIGLADPQVRRTGAPLDFLEQARRSTPAPRPASQGQAQAA